MNYQLFAPGVNLFVFQIEESSILINDSHNDNKNLLWKTCNNLISTVIPDFQLLDWLDLKKQPNYHRENLIKTDKIQVYTKKDDEFLIPNSIPLAGKIDLENNESIAIKGFVYPVRIFNNNGFWLNLHRSETNFTEVIDIELLHKLNLNKYFFVVKNNPSLSQSLIITVPLTAEYQKKLEDKQALRNLAEEYLKLFFPKGEEIPPCNRVGYLFGSPIFQYGLITELPTSGTIYVWFFYSKKAQNILREYHQDIFDLFFYRNQAIQAYQKIQDIISTTLVEKYANIKLIIEYLHAEQQKYDEMNEEMLNRLKTQSRQLPTMARDYDETLTTILNLQNEIDIALQKYNETIDRFDGKISKRYYKFLENFSRNSSVYVQANIKARLRTFQYGSNLIDKTLVSIRSIIEIEQTELEKHRQLRDKESEHQLQINVLAVGSGIAVGGIVSTSYSSTVKREDALPAPWYLSNFHPFPQSIFWSVLSSIVFGKLIQCSMNRFWKPRK